MNTTILYLADSIPTRLARYFFASACLPSPYRVGTCVAGRTRGNLVDQVVLTAPGKPEICSILHTRDVTGQVLSGDRG